MPNDSRTRGKNRFYQERPKTDTYRQPFFPKTIRDWNQLPATTTSVVTVEGFRASLKSSSGNTLKNNRCNCKLEIVTVLYVNNIEKTCCVARHCPKFSSGTNCIRLTNPVPYIEEEENRVTKKLYVLCFVNGVHIRLIYCLTL